MGRRALIAFVIAASCAAVSADVVVLEDGRTLTGKVTVEGDQVTVVLSYATLRFPRSRVQSIERKQTPQEELATRLAKADATSADSLAEVAAWADDNGLAREADQIYAKVIELDPDHAAAREGLGYVKIEGTWRTFDKALEVARSKLLAGPDKNGSLTRTLLPTLDRIARTPAQRISVRDLTGQALLMSAEFAKAQTVYTKLSQDNAVPRPRAMRYAAVAEILANNSDGMYVLTSAYPGTASLTGSRDKAVGPGLASLARPLVLEAALRDTAKKHILLAEKHMGAAAKVEATDPDAADARYAQALRALDTADAISPGRTLSYRVEIARRRIGTLRKAVDASARSFDAHRNQLGRKDLNIKEYRTLVLRLLHELDSLREDLQAILKLTEPHPRELVLEQKWAETDLRKVVALRKVLTEELNGKP